jgi:hypothetical protein
MRCFFIGNDNARAFDEETYFEMPRNKIQKLYLKRCYLENIFICPAV